MQNTTLCYLEHEDSYLMMLRNRKKGDMNWDKWIGIGGKFDEGETPLDCVAREVEEETGLQVEGFRFRGIVTFCQDQNETEQMFLFTAPCNGGTLGDCPEGELHWVKKEEVPHLNLWEGDLVFLKLLRENAPFFLLKLTYRGDTLTDAAVQYPTV